MAGLPLPDQRLRRDTVESLPVVLGPVCAETQLCKNARVRSTCSLRTFTQTLTKHLFVQHFYFFQMDSQRCFLLCLHVSVHVWLINFNHSQSQGFQISDQANEECEFWQNAT